MNLTSLHAHVLITTAEIDFVAPGSYYEPPLAPPDWPPTTGSHSTSQGEEVKGMTILSPEARCLYTESWN